MTWKGIGHIALALFIGGSVLWPMVKRVVWNSHYFGTKKSEPDSVKISVFDEALCPDCREFVKSQLGPTWEELRDILEVETIAYGWAEESHSRSGYNFTCQHGPDECVSNMILECSKHYIKDINLYVNFTVCFMGEEEPLPPPLAIAEKCVRRITVDWLSIANCTESVEGENLLHEAGVRFHALTDPKPTEVPWILINDEFNSEAAYNLTGVVCSIYQGPTPAACM
ncbi:oxidoreductase activity protein [Halocaridina rubra]|uniref:Oxidoreductase activity protein n=1 Tax=Halocaridina rubra TaxID=373956 RepID=A0AAN8WYB3_HALRR